MSGHTFVGPGQVAPHLPAPEPEAAHGVAPGPLEQLGGQAAVRQLEQIRLVLDAFDWEHDDRQFALEQIDDILRGDR